MRRSYGSDEGDGLGGILRCSGVIACLSPLLLRSLAFCYVVSGCRGSTVPAGHHGCMQQTGRVRLGADGHSDSIGMRGLAQRAQEFNEHDLLFQRIEQWCKIGHGTLVRES